MPWLVGKPLTKRLKNCAVCWTNMKGAVDEYPRTLDFSEHAAFSRMGPPPFSMARYGSGSAGGGPDGALPSVYDSLRSGGRGTPPDACGAGGHVPLPHALRRHIFCR